MILFSFILPAYKLKFLDKAITSILKQSYTNFELIIIDDDSPEGLSSVVSSFSDPRIRYHRNQRNIGGENLVRQWNYCIEYANGEYLILAADDDEYDIDFLSKMMGLILKYPEVNLFRSRVALINEQNELIGIDGVLPEFVSKYQYLYYYLNASFLTCIGNFVFKSSVIKEKKFIDFPSAFGSDTASMINISDSGVVNSAEMLFRFRVSSIHLSSNNGLNVLLNKLDATNQLFKWIKELSYNKPQGEIDLYCYRATQWDYFYQKYKYDCYNLVIKNMPLNRLNLIQKCTLLTKKDRMLMLVRYFLDKVFKR